ncbi:hypothetical protein CCAL12920_00715 [Campylobacter sp. RM12920]|uniref:Uncharacterized protein n=1 Tax=Campylobacter californiensis TaxID=1032243 RepID=A0ABD4JFI6_9BACT|nr:hypothetical protein [Campylobacter sp. RM12919]MBE2987422.1 hypothetical protein [Campylobacter sp. RM12920]
MRTRFPFTLEIDDENFKLIYKDPNKKQSDEFLSDFKSLKAVLDSYDELKSEIEMLIEKKELKKELVKDIGKESKKELTNEIFALIDEIADKKSKLKEFDDKSVDLEAVAEKRFEFCVEGEDKERLKRLISQNAISYHQLIDAIDKAVAKEREKK